MRSSLHRFSLVLFVFLLLQTVWLVSWLCVVFHILIKTSGSCHRHLHKPRESSQSFTTLLWAQIVPSAAVALCTPQRVTCVTMTLEGGEPSEQRLEEQWPACFEWQRLGGCSLSEYPSQKALISPELCPVLLSDRTSIVRPPEDSTVIKGTTATLRCEATHDPRISIRLVVSLLVCVVYPSLIL